MRWIPFLVVLAAACSEPQQDANVAQRRASQQTTPQTRRVTVSDYRVTPEGFEVRAAEGWPGRALDPVLTIGGAEYREYDFTAPDTIRFRIPAGAALPAGAPVFVQYGDDAGSRVVVTQALAVRP